MKIIAPEKLYASYINLDHRIDRNEHMIKQLIKANIHAVRTRGMLPNEYSGPEHKVSIMRNSKIPGTIGCHFSQIKVMETALSQNKSAFVMEDDIVFCEDIQKRFLHIDNFLSNNEWDVFWLGGTYCLPPTWHATNHYENMQCKCNLNRDWEPTTDQKIVRTYGCWSTYAYIVNINSLEKILKLLDENVYMSRAIDWLFIYLQPKLKTYAFNPGCVMQMSNISDIHHGNWSPFEDFIKLGPHVWANNIEW